MNKEFFEALDLIEREKGISKEYMIAKIEAALANACRKEIGQSTVVRVNLDPVKPDLKVYQQRLVVPDGEVEDEKCQIALSDAKAISRRHKLGGYVETELKTYADAYNMPIEKIKTLVSVEDVKADLACRKAMDLVKDTAVATAKKAPAKKAEDEAEEKPAKKAPAKKASAKKTEDEAEEKPAKKAPAKKAPAKKTTSKKASDAE